MPHRVTDMLLRRSLILVSAVPWQREFESYFGHYRVHPSCIVESAKEAPLRLTNNGRLGWKLTEWVNYLKIAVHVQVLGAHQVSILMEANISGQFV